MRPASCWLVVPVPGPRSGRSHLDAGGRARRLPRAPDAGETRAVLPQTGDPVTMTKSSDEMGVAAAELREVAEGRMNEGRMLSYPLAPYLDGAALRRYCHYKRRYSSILERDREVGDGDLPPRFERTQYCKNLVAVHGSPLAARAVREGWIAALSFITGLTNRTVDFSTAQLLSKLLHHLRRDGYMATFVGSTDAGKTATALLLAALHLRDNPDAHLVCNLEEIEWPDPSMNDRTHFAETPGGVKGVAEEYEDVMAVLDELSSEANAQTSSYDVNEHLYPLITAKAKLGLRIVGIGHREDGFDIAPPLRENSDHFVQQEREQHDLGEDVYRAHFWNELSEGDFESKAFTLDPVPKPDVHYDPDEAQSFTVAPE